MDAESLNVKKYVVGGLLDCYKQILMGPIETQILIQKPSKHISLGEGVAACAAWPSANTASVAGIGAALATFSYLFSFSIAFMYCGGGSFIIVKFFGNTFASNNSIVVRKLYIFVRE